MNFRKTTPFFFIFLGTFLFFTPPVNGKEKEPESKLKIAFGSCLDQNLKKDIWIPILKEKPDLWIWLGDNIYKDTTVMTEKKSAYDLLKSDEHYTELRKKTKILGTWDDHDYGINDAGAEYPMKNESKDLFLDFFDIPLNSPVRKHEGIYSSHVYRQNQFSIRIILLDTRTFRTELKESPLPDLGSKVYIANDDPNATILGTEQWKWLENELRNKDDLFIIVSSIQVLNDTHRYEKWSNFPGERSKLTSLIDKYAAGKSLILSGDRHIAEIFEEPLASGWILADITSSSLNKPIPLRAIEVEDPRRKTKIYAQENFGLIEIRKKKKALFVDVSIVGLEGKVLEREYQFTKLNQKKKSKQGR